MNLRKNIREAGKMSIETAKIGIETGIGIGAQPAAPLRDLLGRSMLRPYGIGTETY